MLESMLSQAEKCVNSVRHLRSIILSRLFPEMFRTLKLSCKSKPQQCQGWRQLPKSGGAKLSLDPSSPPLATCMQNSEAYQGGAPAPLTPPPYFSTTEHTMDFSTVLLPANSQKWQRVSGDQKGASLLPVVFGELYEVLKVVLVLLSLPPQLWHFHSSIYTVIKKCKGNLCSLRHRWRKLERLDHAVK